MLQRIGRMAAAEISKSTPLTHSGTDYRVSWDTASPALQAMCCVITALEYLNYSGLLEHPVFISKV